MMRKQAISQQYNFKLLWVVVGAIWCAVVAGTVAVSAHADDHAEKKIIDLGQLEIEGELRRPGLQWLDSSKRMKEFLPRIYAEQFRRLEDELLRPMSPEHYRGELKKEERLVSN